MSYLIEGSGDLVIDVKVGKLGGREFRRLPFDEALPDLVAVEGVLHEECCELVVVVVVVVGAAVA